LLAVVSPSDNLPDLLLIVALRVSVDVLCSPAVCSIKFASV